MAAIKRVRVYLANPDSGAQTPAYSREALEAIFEASYDGIYITDGDAVTMMVNKSYESVSGLRREDMLGQSMRDLVNRHVISQSGTLLALERREPVTIEQIFKTGKRAIITSTPIFNEDDQIVMVVTNVRDVTELHSLQKELEKSRERNQQYYTELELLRRRMNSVTRVIAEDPAMKAVLRVADKVAELDVPVLLEGETGCGKQELAQYIVSKSRRRKGKFIEVNCSAYSEEMLEQELFGIDAKADPAGGRVGLFELADGGTVLLREVSELPGGIQMRLVRLMQTHLVSRVGGSAPHTVDVRLLASTCADLKKLVAERKFREDLYYLLNVLPIQVLPLRQRREDIIPLAEEFCIQINKKYHRRKRFSHMALLALKGYSWPGNLRELRNVVESAMILCSDDIIDPQDLAIYTGLKPARESAASLAEPVDLRRMLEDMELKYIHNAYQKHGNVRDAARSLGMDPSTYVRKRKKLEGRDAGVTA